MKSFSCLFTALTSAALYAGSFAAGAAKIAALDPRSSIVRWGYPID